MCVNKQITRGLDGRAPTLRASGIAKDPRGDYFGEGSQPELKELRAAIEAARQ